MRKKDELSMDPETLLPETVLRQASLQGHEYAWQQVDVIPTLHAAAAIELAVMGGQTQFRFPDGTYELYWLNFDATPKQAGEAWSAFVARSAQEVVTQFERLCQSTDFVQEAVNATPSFLQRGEPDKLLSYLYFVLYFDTATTYAHHHATNIGRLDGSYR